MSVPIFDNSVFIAIREDYGDIMVFNSYEAAKTYCEVYGCKEPVTFCRVTRFLENSDKDYTIIERKINV